MDTTNLPTPMDTQSSVSVPLSGSTIDNTSSTSIPLRRNSVTFNGSGAGSRRHSTNSLGGERIFCPVVDCPEALSSSNKHFRDIASIKSHLDDHITGYRPGAVPSEFLRQHDYSQCDICDKIVHKRYKGKHPRCRPRAFREEQINRLRNPDNRPKFAKGTIITK